MGDLINCFYQCKQMPGLGCVAEEKESEHGDECACMRVRKGQSPRLGGLLMDEILFHYSRAGRIHPRPVAVPGLETRFLFNFMVLQCGILYLPRGNSYGIVAWVWSAAEGRMIEAGSRSETRVN